MKYMIMTFGDTSALEGKSPEWIKEMIEFMQRIDVELTESGEPAAGPRWRSSPTGAPLGLLVSDAHRRLG